MPARSKQGKRVQVAEASRQSEETKGYMLAAALDGIFLLDPEGLVVEANEVGASRLGATVEKMIGRDVFEFIPPNIVDLRRALFRELVESCQPMIDTHQRDGIWFETVANPYFDDNGALKWVSIVTRDITERKNVEAALQRSEAELVRAQRTAHIGNWVWNPVHGEYSASAELYRLLGLELDDELTPEIFETFVHPDDLSRVRGAAENCLRTAESYDIDYRIVRRSGEERHVHLIADVIVDDAGRPMGAQGTAQDITERKRIEVALRESQYEMAEAQRMAHIGIWRWDIETDKVTWSDEHWAICGLEPGEVDEIDPDFFDTFIHPDDLEVFKSVRRRTLESGLPFAADFRIVRRNGEVRYVHSQTGSGGHAHVRHVMGTIQDITERKRIEDQLRQAQKMDAVGQLTGGVAHDFNNLLTALLGSLQLLADRLGGDELAERYIDICLRAVKRGADLTQRLLALSRKQPLAPAATDVNDLLTETSALMKSTLGGDIDLRFVAASDLRSAMVDRQQLENAILNLALNARDAMPTGGHLTIETSNVILDDEYDEVTPGPYVLIVVSDTGTGMSPLVLGQAFEPFFTTKDVGRGSGLGLSMVYGFAKQSGGHVAIDSEIGQGTTVKLYLPEATAEDAPLEGTDRPDAPVVGGDEALLVLEDDDDVRAFLTTVLRHLGYAVVEAARGSEAIAKAAGGGFDLFLTDVVLPDGLSGPETARHIREDQPHLKVLFTSAYAENQIVHEGRLDDGVDLLLKPYSKDVLARRVRAALDAAPPGTARHPSGLNKQRRPN